MKEMRWNFIGVFVFCTVVLFFNFCNAVSAEEQILIVATDYPPYEIEHPDGDLRGFDVEVTEEAFRRTGIKATYEFYPWSRCIAMVNEGKATALLSAAKNKEREKTMIFSEPISSMTDVLLVNKDYEGPALAKIKNLGKLKLLVGVSRGSFTEKSLKEYDIPYDISPTDEIAIKKLLDKRIDVIPAVLEHILYYSKKNKLTDKFKWFVMEDVKTSVFHLAFGKKWQGVENIVLEFNQKLNEMKQDGTYDAIHQKYR